MLEQETFEIRIEKEKEVEKTTTTIKRILLWVVTHLPFIFIPASGLEELSEREAEYEKAISRRKFIRRFKSFLTILGIVLVFLVITLAVFPHWLSPYTYAEALGVFPGSFQPPSPEHLLGTTKFGRDVLSRLIFGTRTSLTVALPSIGLSVIAGVIVGIIAGFYGGWVDSIIMRIVDILLAFPGIILALVFISVFQEIFDSEVKIEYIMLAYGILGIPFYARLIRGSVLQAKQLPYIEAARVAGASNWRIMFRHILPNVIQPVIISLTFQIGGIILSLAGLSFLGFSDPTMMDWGYEISSTRERLYDAPWASLFPGVFILITVLGFMLLGDGLRDALDPRLKNL
ncbi:MAG: ABC transporter permease [Promethearchaeota archaeon]|nr:MAG: ABC transporter permease [Candidatus Lokiarchaeota archaeon]